MADLVGNEGGGERSQDKERASLVYGFLCRANMRCSSSFVPFGPTRSDRSQKAVQSFTAHLDFLLASPNVRFAPHIGRDFPFKPLSDHTPVVGTVTAVGHSRAARRDLFRGTLLPPQKWDQTLSTAWLPDDPQSFRDRLRTLNLPPKLEDWPAFILPIAREQTKWKEALVPGLLKKLWWHLRRTSDPLLRKAFQLHIRQLERDRKDQQQRDQLLKWASSRDLHTRRTVQAKHRIHIPESLDGENNRARWGEMVGKFWQDIYLPPQDELRRTEILYA